MVIGSRGKGGSDELHGTFEQFLRYVGSQLIMLAINYRFGVRLTDSQNGFRALRRDVGHGARHDLEPDDHRAGDADEGAQARLPRRRRSPATSTRAAAASRRSSSGSCGGPTSGRSSVTSSDRRRTGLPDQPVPPGIATAGRLEHGRRAAARVGLHGRTGPRPHRRGRAPFLRPRLGRAVLPLPHRRALRVHRCRAPAREHGGGGALDQVLHVLAAADARAQRAGVGVRGREGAAGAHAVRRPGHLHGPRSRDFGDHGHRDRARHVVRRPEGGRTSGGPGRGGADGHFRAAHLGVAQLPGGRHDAVLRGAGVAVFAADR